MRGAVKPSMSWLQAAVALVTHVVELPLPILPIVVVVVLGYSNTSGNTLTSYTLTITLLLTVRRAGLFATRACPTLRLFVLVLLDMIVYLCRTIASKSARVMLSLCNVVRCSNS